MEKIKPKSSSVFLLLSFTLLVFLFLEDLKAQTPPAGFTYQGRVYKSNGVDPVNAPSVLFRLQVYSPDGTCMLYEETHTRDMSRSDGMFSLNVGAGTSSHVSSLDIFKIFDNASSKTGAHGCTYTPAAGDSRRLRFGYNDGTEAVTFSNDQVIQSVPYAMTAQNIEGVSKSQILQANTQTTQAKLDIVMAGYTNLTALINGTSTQYAKAGDLPISGGVLNLSSGGVKVSDSPSSGQFAVNKNYTDARLGGQTLDTSGISNGQSLVWNASQSKWVASSPSSGTLTSVTAGTGLAGGTITSTGTISLAPVGNAGSYPKVTVDAYGRVTAGAALTSSDLPAPAGDISGSYAALTVSKIKGVAVSGTAPTSGQVLKYNSSTYQWEPGTDNSATGVGAGTVTSVTASGLISVANGTSTPAISLQSGTSTGQSLVWDGSAWGISYVNATQLRNSSSLAQFPTTSCAVSKTLVYQVPSDTYACVDIAITASQVSGLGGAAILSLGTAAGTVAAGNDSRIVGALQSSTSVAGDLSGTMSIPTVAKIQGVAVSSTAPTNGQVLKYNSITTKWEGATDNSNAGTVTGVTAGTGLTGGTISSSGTIAVNVGTGANQIVQLDSSSKLPAVDGSQLTGMPVVPFTNAQPFITSGSFVVPAKVTKLYVQVWGGGGAGATGANSGSGGAAGGYAAGFVTVNPGDTISYTVGAGGTAGNSGGDSSFSSYLQGNGGTKGLTIVFKINNLYFPDYLAAMVSSS